MTGPRLWALDAREAAREAPRGIGLYQRHLLRELALLAPEDGFLLYHQRPWAGGDCPRPARSRLRRIDLPGDRWFLWELVRLPLALLRDRPAAFHGTGNTLPPWLPCPAVVTLHDVIVLWWEHDPPDSYVRHCRRVTARTIRTARIILTVSEYSRREILARFPRAAGRVRVFHNGLQPLFQQEAPAPAVAEARRRLGLEKPYLFAIGSPLLRKNTAGLIRAAGSLRREGRLEHRLAVSGLAPGEQEPFRALAAAEGLEDALVLLPYLTAADLRSLYAGADLFVYPSHAEGWGIPVLEAHSQGTPVAASRTTSIPEAGGDFARYFDPADPAAMAAVLAEALRSPAAWADRRREAQARARSFRWEDAARVTLAAYREAAGGRRS